MPGSLADSKRGHPLQTLLRVIILRQHGKGGERKNIGPTTGAPAVLVHSKPRFGSVRSKSSHGRPRLEKARKALKIPRDLASWLVEPLGNAGHSRQAFCRDYPLRASSWNLVLCFTICLSVSFFGLFLSLTALSYGWHWLSRFYCIFFRVWGLG